MHQNRKNCQELSKTISCCHSYATICDTVIKLKYWINNPTFRSKIMNNISNMPHQGNLVLIEKFTFI